MRPDRAREPFLWAVGSTDGKDERFSRPCRAVMGLSLISQGGASLRPFLWAVGSTDGKDERFSRPCRAVMGLSLISQGGASLRPGLGSRALSGHKKTRARSPMTQRQFLCGFPCNRTRPCRTFTAPRTALQGCDLKPRQGRPCCCATPSIKPAAHQPERGCG